MPGRIVQVLVQIGQKVSKGQPLMIMEAMKMEVMKINKSLLYTYFNSIQFEVLLMVLSKKLIIMLMI